MAKFITAFEKTMKNEGGYILHRNKGESADTYAGIYRKSHPTWEGWSYIDNNETPPTDLVRNFYKVNYWNKIKGDDIINQKAAENIYDFYVNAGTNGIKVAQEVSKCQADGIFGNKTLNAINEIGEDFTLKFVLARCSYYGSLISKKQKYAVFAKGWIDRAIRGIL